MLLFCVLLNFNFNLKGTTNTQDDVTIHACAADSADDSQNSEDDFEPLPVSRKSSPRGSGSAILRKRRAIIEDDSSRDSFTTSTVAANGLSGAENGGKNSDNEGSVVDVTSIDDVGKPVNGLDVEEPVVNKNATDVVVLPVDDNTPLLHQGVFTFQFGIQDGGSVVVPRDLSELAKQVGCWSFSYDQGKSLM